MGLPIGATQATGIKRHVGHPRQIAARDFVKLTPELAFSLALQRRTGVPSILEDKRFFYVAIKNLIRRKIEFRNPLEGVEPTSQEPLSVRVAAQRYLDRADILLSSKSGYLKPVFLGGSEGLMLIELNGEEIQIKSKDISLLLSIVACFSERKGRNDYFRIELGASDYVSIKVLNPSSPTLTREDLARFFDYMEEIMLNRAIAPSKGRPYGETVFEETIRTPQLPNGSNWEIRSINQTVKGRLFQADCTRLDASGFYIGLLLPQFGGGKKKVLTSLEGVSAAYKRLYPEKSDTEIRVLAGEFLQTAAKMAGQVRDQLAQALTRLRNEYLPDFPMREIPMASFAVDFMGMLTEDGKMVPEIVDVNAVDYGASFIRAVSPWQHNEILLRAARITADTYLQLGPVAKELVTEYAA